MVNVSLKKRDDPGLLGGLWEFPTIETQATNSEKINALFQNRFGKQIKLEEKMGSAKHSYSHFKVDIDFYLFTASKKLKSEAPSKLIKIDEFDNYAFSKINHKLKGIINND
jgi:A/G-specific DNA glycosylase